MQFYQVKALLSLSFTIVSSYALAVSEASSSSLNTQNDSQDFSFVKIIHQFPIDSGIENLAVRENENVLMTIIEHSKLYQIDSSQDEFAKLISNSFDSATRLLSIIETYRDVFYVVTDNFFTTTFKSIPDS